MLTQEELDDLSFLESKNIDELTIEDFNRLKELKVAQAKAQSATPAKPVPTYTANELKVIFKDLPKSSPAMSNKTV